MKKRNSHWSTGQSKDVRGPYFVLPYYKLRHDRFPFAVRTAPRKQNSDWMLPYDTDPNEGDSFSPTWHSTISNVNCVTATRQKCEVLHWAPRCNRKCLVFTWRDITTTVNNVTLCHTVNSITATWRDKTMKCTMLQLRGKIKSVHFPMNVSHRLSLLWRRITHE